MHACPVQIFDASDMIPSRCNTEIAIKKLVVVVTTSLSGVPQFDEELTMLSLSASMTRNATRTLIPPFHPCGITIEIVGIVGRGDCGRSCKENDVCGTVLQEDSVVRIRHVQITGEMGKEESALAVYWISNGIDCCRVGFLSRHLVKQWQQYDGRLIPRV